MIELFFYYFFATFAVVGALFVVINQNVARMAFWLIVSLGSTAALFFLMHADFVGATQLLIYVGGTLVLLIFGVMLTSSEPLLRIRMSMGDLVIAGAVGFLFLAMINFTVSAVRWDRLTLRQIRVDLQTVEEHATKRIDSLNSKEDQEEARKRLDEFISLFSESFVATKADPSLYVLSNGAELEPRQEAMLLNYMRTEGGLTFSPETERGGTGRPIGLALLGSRPDQDLDRSDDYPTISPGYSSRTSRKTLDSSVTNEPDLSTGYLLPFEIASVHLLVVLIGAAYLARAKRRVET
ncbi:NADH-quinone oxidoreductase subunit J family protein [Thalassoroseus pseudoceratinae]|uniref:NADH-quinone oxidoreductase subunit J family protein n=1 Tax=Thalassoroseus pseudoceratinae TaxID=2713176 RepID=UPI001423BDFC|nr:NADH-quinone oxidoreductase subunit J [Thalassoroseus pseudoceratinae]